MEGIITPLWVQTKIVLAPPPGEAGEDQSLVRKILINICYRVIVVSVWSYYNLQLMEQIQWELYNVPCAARGRPVIIIVKIRRGGRREELPGNLSGPD